jgi:uncharacterized protein (DUF2147 family)
MKILHALALIGLQLTSAPGLAQTDLGSPVPSQAAPKPDPLRSPKALASKAPSHVQDTVAGFWEQTDNQGNAGAWFYFTQVDGLYQGRIVKTFPPDAGRHDICAACAGNQKNAAMLGLTFVKGMHREGLNYTNGTILDPRDGDVYKAEMQLSADGQKLSVRGYLGIPMLGQTQIWNRLPDDSLASGDIPPNSASPNPEN